MKDITHPTIDETITLATQLHRGQRDKAGVPYMSHLLAVMRRVPERSWHVALLHDSIEDGKTTAEQLLQLGYTQEEVDAVVLLTRKPPYEYAPYIETIATSGNAMAIEVKLADLEDNSDLRRLPVVTTDDELRLEKYRKAYKRLTNCC